MTKKISIKVGSNAKAVAPSDGDALFLQLKDVLSKSGAVSEDNSSVQTGLDKSIASDFSLSTEDYVELCEELGYTPDGSHIEDEEERSAYLEGLTDKEKDSKLDKERILTFRGSDETTDRYGDKVRVKGWDLKAYKTNPVFLAFHDGKSFPVGKTLKVWKEMNDPGAPDGRSLMFHVYFPGKDVSEMSELTYNLYKEGLMNAVSVGFRVKEYNNPSDPEERAELGLGEWGVEFTKQELMELSGVPIPANSNALRVKSLELKELCDRAKVKAELIEDEPEETPVTDKSEEGIQPSEEPVSEPTTEKALLDAIIELTATLKESISVQKNLVLNVNVSELGTESPNETSVEEEEATEKEVGQGLMQQLLADLPNKLSTQSEED